MTTITARCTRSCQGLDEGMEKWLCPGARSRRHDIKRATAPAGSNNRNSCTSNNCTINTSTSNSSTSNNRTRNNSASNLQPPSPLRGSYGPPLSEQQVTAPLSPSSRSPPPTEGAAKSARSRADAWELPACNARLHPGRKAHRTSAQDARRTGSQPGTQGAPDLRQGRKVYRTSARDARRTGSQPGTQGAPDLSPDLSPGRKAHRISARDASAPDLSPGLEAHRTSARDARRTGPQPETQGALDLSPGRKKHRTSARGSMPTGPQPGT
ncbi:serine/arginine repetitive matrix protein 3-like [Hyalella azteca]|uniref:Serine/arginine repetitive matrix protein 3-like n=1 Tax=Hyalella azteca TaxID=294128 RepID=A0A8B7PKP7_HYAAZ|nr:serine/arginine repetitive matrix protein 3-like [Hyalella azteca]